MTDVNNTPLDDASLETVAGGQGYSQYSSTHQSRSTVPVLDAAGRLMGGRDANGRFFPNPKYKP